MRKHLGLLTLAVFAFLSVLVTVQGQVTKPSGPRQTGVVITNLHEPVYPPIARAAHITGDVVLSLQIQKDGTIKSVEFVSGPLLLKEAAVDSAKESQFECGGCTESLTPYPLVYSFQLSDNVDCCSPSSGPPQVSVSQNHVSVTMSAPPCCCDPVIIKTRSIKCLYLWRCSTR